MPCKLQGAIVRIFEEGCHTCFFIIFHPKVLENFVISFFLNTFFFNIFNYVNIVHLNAIYLFRILIIIKKHNKYNLYLIFNNYCKGSAWL